MTGEEGAPRELPGLVESTGARKEMESVTEVNGTVARFEMAYSPPAGAKGVPFGPPLRQRVPAYVFLALATSLGAVVASAYYGSSNTRLYAWLIEGQRALPAPVLAWIVFLSALGTVMRAHMRGVVVFQDGRVARSLLPLGLPRVQRWVWSQIARIVVDDESAMLELWDGRYERLPEVARPEELHAILADMASKRNITVTRLSDAYPKGSARK